jgi:hypothetical protein
MWLASSTAISASLREAATGKQTSRRAAFFGPLASNSSSNEVHRPGA